METDSWDYSIIISSKKTLAQVQKLFATFDSGTQIDFMYESEWTKYFEVFLASDSIFRQEMLEDIESWILPENFLWVEIVFPEVFGINTTTQSWILSTLKGHRGLSEEKGSTNLTWEDISETWGIEKYKSYEYIEDSKTESWKIKVWVVDTGIDYNHPDLKNNVNQKLGKDFVNDDDDAWDDQWHGTHVAGTIAANINGQWIIWVNPYVELVPLKICTSRGFCPSYAVLRALDYAKKQKIDILNMSLWGRWNPNDHAICWAISSVVDAGGIVVAASGNSNIDTKRFVPGWCPKAITVAAVDGSWMRAPFSNYGDKVDVSAPWVQVYSTYPLNKWTYKKLSGTSMSTPHVVGIVSLMHARDSDVTTEQVKIAFKKYENAVQTDRDYKTIASGIHLEKLMGSYNITPDIPKTVIPETVVKEEPVEKKEVGNEVIRSEEIVQQKEGEKILLEALPADISLKWKTTWNVQQEEVQLEEDEWSDDVSIASFIPMNLWDDGVNINSSEGFDYVTEGDILDLDQEFHDEYDTLLEKQVYWQEGEILDGAVEINSADSVETLWEAISWDFDLENLPEKTSRRETSGEIFEDVEEKVEEIFIDGAEARVEINSDGVPEVFVFQTWAIDENTRSELVDQDGNPIEIGDFEDTQIVEELDYEHTEELLIDWAETGVEINSSDTKIVEGEPLELENYNPESENFEIIEWQDIIWYDEAEES